jgi:hypothetical protein
MTMVDAIRSNSSAVAVGVAAAVADASPAKTSASSLLPDPDVSSLGASNIGEEIAKLVMKSAQDQKETARKEQNEAEAIEDQEEAAQVQAMHQQADDIRSGGIAEGLCDAASGMFMVDSGACELHGKTGDATIDKGLAEGAKAAGTALGALGRGAAKDDEARATQHEQGANHAKHRVDDAHDMKKDADQLVKDAIDFYREYSSSTSQTKSAALHRA